MNVQIHTWYIFLFLNTWPIHAKMQIWCCWHMCCTSIIFWFFLCAALVAVDVSQQWTAPNGESLLPSRWNDLELAKNKGLDNDDSNGRCLGWRCLAWVRCQNHKDMIHTMFGGNRNGNGSGRATLSKVSLLTGAANFDAETFHPDPSNVWYGQCVLAFSFILRAGDGSRYKFKCVLVSTLEEYVCRDDLIPGQSQCIMWCCIVFQSRADKTMICHR